MDKKDIYEHLAKIYLDASSKRNKKSRRYLKIFKPAFSATLLVALGLGLPLFVNLVRNRSLNSEIALVVSCDAAKINFNFDPAKKESYSIGLNKLDLSRFRRLGFSVKKANYADNISLRVEFIGPFKENAALYLRDITHKWKEYKLDFSEFKNITNWSGMSALSFTVEEWNARDKKGVVYIDNIRFLK